MGSIVYFIAGFFMGFGFCILAIKYKKHSEAKLTTPIFLLIDSEQFDKAEIEIEKVRKIIGHYHPDITRALSLIHFLR